MSLPKPIQTLLSKRLSLIDSEVDNFDVKDEQEQIFKALQRFLIKELDLDKDGNIKRSVKNLKAVQNVKTLRNIVFSDNYKAKVSKYISTFDKVRTLSDEYITEL